MATTTTTESKKKSGAPEGAATVKPTTTTAVDVQSTKKDISAQVLARVDAFQRGGELRLPKDYSPENALKSAYIVLTETPKGQESLLSKCSKESVANALLKMVVWGLTPLKKQCYFIPYGDKLECVPDYSGNIGMAKRYGGLKSIKANAVFEGDTFVYKVGEDGRRKLVEHTQTLESINGAVVGAYAVYEMEDGRTDMEVMSIEMIRNAWAQGGSKGASPAHRNFADQMACKTVINRACKLIIRGSDDSILYDDDTETPETVNRAQRTVESGMGSGEVVDFEDVTPSEAPTEPDPAPVGEDKGNAPTLADTAPDGEPVRPGDFFEPGQYGSGTDVPF